jgi:hypothetical protein
MEGRMAEAMSLVLDLANMVGGLLLAIPLLRRLPSIGSALGAFAGRVVPWGWIVGVVALAAGGFYLIEHVISGPHVFHFEVVGIAVGVLLAWERLTKRGPLTQPAAQGEVSGLPLLLAVFGIIAIAVGVQGLLTPG